MTRGTPTPAFRDSQQLARRRPQPRTGLAGRAHVSGKFQSPASPSAPEPESPDPWGVARIRGWGRAQALSRVGCMPPRYTLAETGGRWLGCRVQSWGSEPQSPGAHGLQLLRGAEDTCDIKRARNLWVPSDRHRRDSRRPWGVGAGRSGGSPRLPPVSS